MVTTNHYQTLGVSPSATPREITEAYRRLVIQFHPDKNPGQEERFRNVCKAYDVLKDPEIRKEYDQMLSPSEVVRPKSIKKSRGENLRVALNVTARELAQGVTKTIQTQRMGLCPHCHGTRAASGKDLVCKSCGGSGYEPISVILSSKVDCVTCKGYGHVPDGPLCEPCRGSGLMKETIRRDITLNPVLGSTMLLYGSGNCCPHGGQPGNLSVDFIIEKDPVYSMHGLKLRRQLKITPAQAALGDEIRLDVFGTPVDVLIPSGSQPGRLIEIEGAGLSYEGRRGNLEIQIWITIPDVVDEAHRELYERLRTWEKEHGRID